MKFSLASGTLFLCYIFFGCKENTSEKQLPEGPKIEVVKEPVPELDSFSEFPEEVEGCSCYFSKSKSDFAVGKYIYLNNYTNLSFISINGKLIRLNSNLPADSVADLKNSVYSNPEYDLRIRLNSRNQNGDETNWLKGELILTSRKTNVQTTIPFVGECGC